MKRARHNSRHALFATALFLAVFLAGCADDFSGTAEDEVGSTAVIGDEKFRHGKFLSRAVRSSTSKLAKDGDQALGIVFELSPNVVNKQRVLERLKILERFKVLERFEFKKAFNGYAIEVMDMAEFDDYSAFLEMLFLDPDVLWFEPDMRIDLPSASFSLATSSQMMPWSVAAVGSEESWARSGNAEGSVDVDVYVLDTGVASEDLNVVSNIDFRSDVTGDPSDYDGHGTHVAAIIGAIDDHDGLVGIAPGARIHNLKVLGDNGKTDVSVVVAAMEYIIAQKEAAPSTPMVVNMSIGENIGSADYTALDMAVEAAIDAGITCVIAAGNYGVDASLVTPAHVGSAITVGAHDMARRFSSFSGYGSLVDILAPGDGIISLQSGDDDSSDDDGVASPAEMSGTSMAAAHVTGAVALHLAAHPQASPAEVLSALQASSRSDLFDLPLGTANRRLWVGAGSSFSPFAYAGESAYGDGDDSSDDDSSDDSDDDSSDDSDDDSSDDSDDDSSD